MTSSLANERDDSAPVALVHIGTHKTGTTSFQRWAEENRQHLLENAGVDYYRGIFGANHYEVPMLCLRRGFDMPMRRRHPEHVLQGWQDATEQHVRQQAARDTMQLLISAEALSYVRHAEEVERLADLLAPRRLSVVVVLREPSSFLQSYRRQLRKTGVTPSSDPTSFAYVRRGTWLTDYGALVDAYRNVLGADAVTTVSHEGALAEKGSVIPAILEAFGIEESSIPPWQTEFRNATPRRTQVARRLVRRYPGLRRLKRSLSRGRVEQAPVRAEDDEG